MSYLQETDLIMIIRHHIIPALNNPKLNANKDKIIQYFKDKGITTSKFVEFDQKSLVENLQYYLGQKSLHVTLIKFHHEIISYLENIKTEFLSYCTDYTVGDIIEININKNKNSGIIRFIGEIEEKNGIYYGIELNSPNGKNNGSLNNIKYFHTQKNKGLFLNKKKKKTLKLIDTMTSLRVTVGDIVRIDKYDCNAIVRFIGETQFRPNIIWYGVQLEQAKGKNNGSIENRKYFTCLPKYGVFVQSIHIESINKFKEKVDMEKEQNIKKTGTDNYDVHDSERKQIHEIPTISILRLSGFITQINDTVINDRKDSMDLSDASYKMIERYYFTVSGYSRICSNICRYNDVMLQILIYYYTNRFMRIYVSKEHTINYGHHIELTNKRYDISLLTQLYSFNDNECPNCKSNELNYCTSFKAVINEQSQRKWYPRGNTYICNKCKYLTVCELRRFYQHQIKEEYDHEYSEDIKHIIDIKHHIMPVYYISNEQMRSSEIIYASCIFCKGNEYFLGFGKGQDKSPYDWMKEYFCNKCGTLRRTKYYDKIGDEKYKHNEMFDNEYSNATK